MCKIYSENSVLLLFNVRLFETWVDMKNKIFLETINSGFDLKDLTTLCLLCLNFEKLTLHFIFYVSNLNEDNYAEILSEIRIVSIIKVKFAKSRKKIIIVMYRDESVDYRQ